MRRGSRGNPLLALGSLAALGLLAAYLFIPAVRNPAPQAEQYPSYSAPYSGSSAVVDIRGSYGNIGAPYNTPAVQEAELQMLYSTGAPCVRVDLGFAAWLTGDQAQVQEAQDIVSSIRSTGHCLILADAASESYRGGQGLPWAEFETAWVQRASTLAALFHPDYYIVIKEPGWYYPMISDARTNPAVYSADSWGNLTASLVAAVKSASPSTRVGVSVAANDLYNSSYSRPPDSIQIEFLRHAEMVSGLDFIGFDVYTPTDLEGAATFMHQFGSGGKSVWVAEAWSTPSGAASANDSAWMRTLFGFAGSIGATMVVPFFTDDFVSYGLASQTSAAAILAAYQDQRTPVFYAFRQEASVA